MTVKELMEKLKELPDDIKIWFQQCDSWGLWSTYEWNVRVEVLDLVNSRADEYEELEEYMNRLENVPWPKSVLESDDKKVKSERFLIFTI